MIPLLELALDAHGGLTRWRQVKSIDLKLSIGGQLWHAKGLPQGLNVALHVEPSRKLVVVSPFDSEDSTVLHSRSSLGRECYGSHLEKIA